MLFTIHTVRTGPNFTYPESSFRFIQQDFIIMPSSSSSIMTSLPPLAVRLDAWRGGAAEAGSLGSHAARYIITPNSLLLPNVTTTTTMTAAEPHATITTTTTTAVGKYHHVSELLEFLVEFLPSSS